MLAKEALVVNGLLPKSLERTLISAAVLRFCSAAVERKKVERVEAGGEMANVKSQ